MMTSKQDIVFYGFRLYKFQLEFMHRRSKYTTAFRIFTLSMYLFTFVLTAINLGFSRGKAFFKTFESFITEFHMLEKYLIFIYYKPDFERFLDDIAYFWTTDSFEAKIREEINGIHKFINSVQKCLIVLIYLAALTFISKPLLSNDPFLLESWIPADNVFISKYTILAAQYYLMATGPIAIGFECVFSAITCHVLIQFRLIKYKLQSLCMDYNGDVASDDFTHRELTKCVEHHKFMRQVYFRVRNIYSIVFLTQYMLTLLTICLELYVLTISTTNLDFNEIIRAIFYGAAVTLQFAFYCFPAEQFKSEAADLCNGIYKSRWYESKITHQKDLLIVMVMAQETIQYTGGGLMDISIDTFTSVIRKAFSFYTMLRTLLDI